LILRQFALKTKLLTLICRQTYLANQGESNLWSKRGDNGAAVAQKKSQNQKLLGVAKSGFYFFRQKILIAFMPKITTQKAELYCDFKIKKLSQIKKFAI